MKLSLSLNVKRARGFEAETPPEKVKFSAKLWTAEEDVWSEAVGFAPQFEVNWDHSFGEFDVESLKTLFFEEGGLSVAVVEVRDDNEVSEEKPTQVALPCTSAFFSGLFRWEGWVTLGTFGEAAELLCNIELSDSLFLHPDEIDEANMLTIAEVSLKNTPVSWLLDNDEDKLKKRARVSIQTPLATKPVEFETLLDTKADTQDDDGSQEKAPIVVVFDGLKKFFLNLVLQRKLQVDSELPVQLTRLYTVNENDEEKEKEYPLKAKGVLSIKELTESNHIVAQVVLSVEEDAHWKQLLEDDQKAKDAFENRAEEEEDVEPPVPTAVDIFSEASCILELSLFLNKPLVTEERKRVEFAERFNPPKTPVKVDPQKKMEEFSQTYLAESIKKLREIYRSMQKECHSDTDIVFPDESMWMYKMNKDHQTLQTEIKHNLSIIANSKLKGNEDITEVHQVIYKEVRKALDRDIQNTWKLKLPEQTLVERVSSPYFEKLAFEMFNYNEWEKAWDFLRRIPVNELTIAARDCLVKTALRINRDNDRIARDWILQNAIEEDTYESYLHFTLLLIEADLSEEVRILLDHLHSLNASEQHKKIYWWVQAVHFTISESEHTKMATDRAKLYDKEQEEARRLISVALSFNSQKFAGVLLETLDKSIDTYILWVKYNILSINPYSVVEIRRICNLILDDEDDDADHVALAQLGHCTYLTGNLDEAREYYLRHLKLCPGTRESFQVGTMEMVDQLAMFRLGKTLLKQKNPTQAKEVFLECLELNKECSLIWFELAKAQVALEEFEDALSSLRTVNHFNRFLDTTELTFMCTHSLELIEAFKCLESGDQQEEVINTNK